MAGLRHPPGAPLLAGLAGASAWISLGTLAVVDERTRVGALPPLWLLPALVVAATGVAYALRLQTARLWPLALVAILWAPWLPVAVPPALLVWEGPLEVLVWSAAVAGVIASLAVGDRLRDWLLSLPPAMAAAGLATLVLVCSLSAAFVLRDRIPGGDEPHYLIITQSLMADGDLRIQNNHDRGDYLAYVATSIPPDFLRRGVDGEIYSIHAPGLPALLIPAFAAGGYPAAVLLLALITAAGVAAGWHGAGVLTRDAGASWAASLAVGFSAPLFLHSFSIFPDPVGAAIVAAAVAAIIVLDTNPFSCGPGAIAGVGALVAVLPWLHTRFAVIAGCAGLVIGLRLVQGPDRWRRLAAFAAVPALSAAAWFLLFWMIYGTPNPAAPYGGSRQNAVAWIGRGLAGLAFDQQFGLLANSPVMALVPAGLLMLWRTRPRLALELVVIAVPYVLIVASFGMWWGGWAAPARFLVPVLPTAVPALAQAWRSGGPTLRAVFAGLTLLGSASVIARVGPGNGALLYNDRDGYDLLLDWASRSVNLPLAFPSSHRTDPRTTALIGGAWLTCAAGGALALSLWARKQAQARPMRGSWWAVTAAIGGAAAVTAMSASWRIASAHPITPASSAADFLARSDGAAGLHAVALNAGRRVPAQAALDALEIHGVERVRGVGDERPLLAVAEVPAGRYRVSIRGVTPLAGALDFGVGPGSAPFDRFDLGGIASGETGIVLNLPVQVASLIVRGDAAARARIVRFALRPLREPADHAPSWRAVRAARYGRTRLFFLDEGAFVEPGGVWTFGNDATRIVAVPDEGAEAVVDVDVQSGPVPARVVLSSGEWRLELRLGPGERRRVRVPSGRAIDILTDGAFRPADVEPGNGDRRLLGVRLEAAN